jgi:ABC-type amino acid transport substrate-binding protein
MRHRVRILWRTSLALLVLATAYAARAETVATRLLFVGNAAPFSSLGASGRPEGYAVTLCDTIAESLHPNIPPSWQVTAIAEGIERLAQGNADMLCGPVTDTVAREARIAFTSPIAIGGISALVRPGAPPWLQRLFGVTGVDPSSPRSLLTGLDWPRRIVVLRGGTAASWLDGLLAREKLDVTALEAADYAAAASALANGEAGAWVGEWTLLAARQRSDARLADMTLLARPIVGEPIAIAIRPDMALRRAVQRSLSAIVHGPDFPTLLSRWLGLGGATQAGLIRSVTPPDGTPPP